ncbi:hypothetical protein [Novipirellula maiorica]|nr:hypothetical protein [Rhodopirellula maiorica]
MDRVMIQQTAEQVGGKLTHRNDCNAHDDDIECVNTSHTTMTFAVS